MAACHFKADILFTVWSSAAASEWRVWFSSLACYRGHSAAAAFPRSESRARARGKELHLSVFCALATLIHTADKQGRPKKKTHIESSGTHLLNVKGKEKKQVHEKKVKRAINTLAEDVMLMINALCQCSNLHQCLEVCEGEYNISLSQWCAQTKSRHWILYHSFLLWWRCLLMS